MKSARLSLVALGVVCQGFAWDEFGLPWIYGGVALACIWLGKKRALTNQFVDGAALVIGCGVGYIASRSFGQSSHFFLGHGLALVQFSRLLRPLSRRDKLFTIVIAFFHLGVAASIVLDYRFIPVFLLSLWLAPKALMEQEAEAFADESVPAPVTRVTWRARLVILAISLLFFFFFPRVLLGPGGAPLGGGADQPTLLDSILDPSGGGLAQSDRVLMQIEGERLRYLKLYALSDFDGLRWSAPNLGALRRISFADEIDEAKHLLRKVRVKHAGYLGRLLPTDGNVVALTGNFFRGPSLNLSGVVECQSLWNTANNFYQYRVDLGPREQLMNEALFDYFKRHPQQSPRLKAWLAERTAGSTNALDIARTLESYLSTNFTYRLGAPDLNRLNFADDFIFNQKEGHCERFAATLALLLRMEGIASRVAVGYTPGSKNPFTGWHTIRFRDAHAWTEAYIPDRGWITLDATPANSGGGNRGWGFGDLLETLDVAWYSHFVNFDTGMQRNLLTVGLNGMASAAIWTSRNSLWLLTVITCGGLMYQLRRWRARRRNRPGADAKDAARIFAEHQYGRMMAALAELGWERRTDETPGEFLRRVEQGSLSLVSPVTLLTQIFCDTRYGELPMSDETRAAAEAALSEIESSVRAQPHERDARAVNT